MLSGHRVVPKVSKPLPLGGPPGQVTIQLQFFFNKDLEYLVLGSKESRSAFQISHEDSQLSVSRQYPDTATHVTPPNLGSSGMFMMDDPNITMEEYIKLQAEKAQRRGQTFNWETATYGKIYCDNLDFFIDFEADFLVLVFTSHAWRRLFEIQGPLVREFMLEFFSTCMSILGSTRVIPDKGDLRDYWTAISFDRDFLGVAPSYTYIRDPVRRLCHRSAEGRKSGARFSGVYFIGRLTAHFGMVSDEGLIGLIVIAREPLMIDIDDLVKLNICIRLNDTWAWVASGLERQPVASAGAQRLEEEVHDLHGDMAEQREVLDKWGKIHELCDTAYLSEALGLNMRTGGGSTSGSLLKEDQST
ncbi:hypothetical protein Tco_0900741 [Tanacetum coccineum]